MMKAPSLASMLKPSYVWNFVSATLRKFCGRDLTQLQLSARSQWNQMYIFWCSGEGTGFGGHLSGDPARLGLGDDRNGLTDGFPAL